MSLGGVFLIKKGKVRIHVMPDFCEEPLPSGSISYLYTVTDSDSNLIPASSCVYFNPSIVAPGRMSIFTPKTL